MNIAPIRWHERRLTIIDQTLLPAVLKNVELSTLLDVWDAIQMLRVRGAPAIGCCAAFGVLVGLREKAPADVAAARKIAQESAQYLATSRPTAVNLFWALDRMRDAATAASDVADVSAFFETLEKEALAIFTENAALCEAIGRNGAALLKDGDSILTHCNAGPLATGAEGTAINVMIAAKNAGKRIAVYVDETRPLLQGARLTTWELQQEDIDVTLICDNTAAQVMREGRVNVVIVGADRIAGNGDAANKIGTYSVAVLAKAHGIPFYVAAPYSTFDFNLQSGDKIPIELRDASEVTQVMGHEIAPAGTKAYCPAFDVTPAELIAGFITEKGVLRPPYEKTLLTLRECAADAR